MNQKNISRETEEFLEDLAEELSVPDARYEQAERSYKSLGEWLLRPDSTVRQFDPQVYVQGSFRLGTTIRPLNETEEYDVDSVCEFRRLGKSQLTQENLKERLRVEIEAYRRSKAMIKPLREGRRCWVLEYADGAQFHMDVVPALPNGSSVRTLLERSHVDARWADTAIAITDNKTPTYRVVTEDWPRSNPKGYASWFMTRTAVMLARRKQVVARSIRASVEEIPDYKVRTPLQAAVMILKRHRDEGFRHRPDDRPISVIVSTLAAHAYAGEETIGAALGTILLGMDEHIKERAGRYWIANPTDPLENFADKWAEHPERAEAFFKWLKQAREDFQTFAPLTNRKTISEIVSRGVGVGLAERARARRPTGSGAPSLLKAATAAPASSGLAFPNQSRVPTKPQGFGGIG